MTSSNTMDWFDDPGEPVDRAAADLKAVGTTARLSLFNAVKNAFEESRHASKVTRKSLAQKLGIAPQVVARLLRQPSNMTIETAARLLFVMGKELRIAAIQPGAHARPYSFHPRAEHALRVWSETRQIGFRDFSCVPGPSMPTASVFISSGRRFLMISGGDNPTDGVHQKVTEVSTVSFLKRREDSEDFVASSSWSTMQAVITAGVA